MLPAQLSFTGSFWACSTQFLANEAYLESHKCIPDALMMPAFVVDRVNERLTDVLPGR